MATITRKNVSISGWQMSAPTDMLQVLTTLDTDISGSIVFTGEVWQLTVVSNVTGERQTANIGDWVVWDGIAASVFDSATFDTLFTVE